MVTLDFKPELEIWQFHACTMRIVQYNVYLRANYRNTHVL